MKTLVYVRPGADVVELCTKVDNGIFEGESGVDTSYIAVEIGVFTEGFVEVKGYISEGQLVVVPR